MYCASSSDNSSNVPSISNVLDGAGIAMDVGAAAAETDLRSLCGAMSGSPSVTHTASAKANFEGAARRQGGQITNNGELFAYDICA